MVIFLLNRFILRCQCSKKNRNQPEAWPPLGYIPNIGLMSKTESTHAMKSLAKVQLYHDILSQSRTSSLWVGEVIQKRVGMKGVAKITISSNEQDPGFGVLHA
jgi:hypothetical protein